MARYKLFLGNTLPSFYFSDDSGFCHFNVTMKTKLTLHGEILGVCYFFEIMCTVVKSK
jgi:hypothetical protein